MTSFDQEYKKTVQKRSDSFMEHVAAAIAEDNFNLLNSVEEMNRGEELPKELQCSIKDIVKKFERRDKRKLRKKQMKSMCKIAAAVFICFVISAAVMVASVEAVRNKVIDFIMIDHGKYVNLNSTESGYVSEEVRNHLPKSWDDIFYPSILPKEYSFREAYDLGSSKTIIFANKKQETISITYAPVDEWQTMADNEDSEVKRIKINNNSGIYFSKDNRAIIHWSQSGFEFNLTTFLPEDKTIEIAENIQYVNLK